MRLQNVQHLSNTYTKPPKPKNNLCFCGYLENDSYAKTSKDIRFPKDAFNYIAETLPGTKDYIKYLFGAMDVLCAGDLTSEYFMELINFIGKNNLSENSIYELPTDAGINACMTEDLDTVNNPCGVYMKEFKDDDEAICFTKTGEVFCTKDSKFAKIKTDEDKVKELKITPKTYQKLFPPVERFLTAQGFSNDCYLLSTINSLFENPKTRCSLLLAFEDAEDGIKIKLPNGKKEFCFKDGEFEENSDAIRLSTGCLGIRMLEYLYGLELLEDKKARGEKIKSLDEINQSIPEEYPTYKNVADYYRENDCKVVKALEKFGFGEILQLHTEMPIDRLQFRSILSKPDDNIIIIGAPFGDRNLYNGNTLTGSHAYQIKPVKTEDGQLEYQIVNASKAAFYTNMSRDDILDNFTYIYIARIA